MCFTQELKVRPEVRSRLMTSKTPRPNINIYQTQTRLSVKQFLSRREMLTQCSNRVIRSLTTIIRLDSRNVSRGDFTPRSPVQGSCKCKHLVTLIGLGGTLNRIIISCIVIRLRNLRWRLKLRQVTDALSGLTEPTPRSALALCSTYFAFPKLARKNRSFKENIDFFL